MNLPSSHINNRRGSSVQSLTPVRDLLCTSPLRRGAVAATGTTPAKSKRVRTGCLTCRERHLKCDEGLPDCLNCRKSSRECKRGVRLNFIDTQVKKPPRLLPPAIEWSVQFQDESRHIASEYVGGLGRYAHLPKHVDDRPAAHAGHLNATIRRQANRRQRFPAILTGPSDPGSDKFFPPTATGSRDMYGYHSARPIPAEPPCPPVDGPQVRHGGETAFPTPQTSAQSGPYYPLQDPYAPLRDDAARSHHHQHRNSDTSSAMSTTPLVTGPPPSFRGVMQGNFAPDGMMTPPPSEKAAAGEREYLNSPDEIYYMQVFVEEVGVWMDSLDKDKHFSRLIPYHALKSPMLLNAFLACGVKHLTLTHPDWKDDKALYYYDTATTQLLRSLQNPDRNTSECATTAVVLNVYEIMSEKPGQQMRMNHIAGARALIRECGWDARSTGIGAACFWLNIGMEVLSCLASNWQTSWDPDQWGLDMEFAAGPAPGSAAAVAAAAAASEAKRESCELAGAGVGTEEEWVRRIFYIVAKIANFRATIPRFQEASPHDEQIRLGNRLAQWQELKRLCDRWNNACPRTMHPFGYLHPSHSKSKSAFPNIWLIKRAAIIGRLFYHTGQCLLAQTNPMEPTRASEEMRVLQMHHAHQVCGIAAHARDRGVASVAIRSLAVASAVLTDLKEQEEVLGILERFHIESGWHLGSVTEELKRGWGWMVDDIGTPAQSNGQAQAQAQTLGHGGPGVPPPPPAHVNRATSFGGGSGPSGPGGPGSDGLGGLTSRFFDGPSLNNATTSLAGQSSVFGGSSVGGSGGAAVGLGAGKAPALSSQGTTSQAQQSNNSRVNPLSYADFSLPNHPYQNWYEPPNRAGSYATQSLL